MAKTIRATSKSRKAAMRGYSPADESRHDEENPEHLADLGAIHPLLTTPVGATAPQRRFIDVAPRAAPSDAYTILALAVTKLQQRAPEAAELFASVAHDDDVREAWLGLAAAHYQRTETALAAKALGYALSRYAATSVSPLADAVAKSFRLPGWCALDSAGVLIGRLVQPLAKGARLEASVDGKPLFLQTNPDGRSFSGGLPDGWRQAGAITVLVDDVALLGSPITPGTIVRVEGFTDSLNGDVHGWAWCPNDPDCNPEISVMPLAGGSGITVVAEDPAVNVGQRRPLARPRGFHIPADQLRGFAGPVRVCGPDGRHLTGSPLDPSVERRSAEAAAQIVAGLFPAPGQKASATSATSRALLLPSVPVHVRGGPVQNGFKKRSVDIIIPVFGGLDLALACLQSVLAALPRWARIVVVDDASPDPRVGQALAKLAARRRITLLTQPVNRGFPGTANAGLRYDATRDVVLLNSDTLVPPNWLEPLREAAYSAPDIGSATPLSNDATILSYPSTEHPNAIPDLSETVRLNTWAQNANLGRLVDIPTAVGFCVYIKRDCLNATGLLREDVFAQGYGEENDFCIRARHLGWRHVAVPSVFVAHVGGQSFGATKHFLIERNMRKLNQLHPGYDALIQAFQAADPLAESRRRLDMERWKTFRTRTRSVLLITHGRSGGVQRHVAERATALRAEGLRPIVLWPVVNRNGKGQDCVLGNGPEGGTPNLRFAIPAELALLAQTLKADRPLRAEVHNMVGHDHRLLDLFKQLRIPYEIVVHDYSWFCPQITLVGASRRYCGEPEVAECEACVTATGPRNEEDIPPRTLRERSAIELAGASNIVVPSDDVAIRLKRHFPQSRPFKVVNWEDDRLLPPPDPSPLASDGIRRVCVVGAIGIEKGYDRLLACARDARDRKLNLRFHLVGYSCDDAPLLATGTVHITGQYDEHAAVPLIRQQQAQLAWLTSLWPETWCYTLTYTWQAGLNVLAFDIGTPAERIRRTGRGWLCPLGLTPQALNNWMLTVRPAETDRGASPFLFRVRTL